MPEAPATYTFRGGKEDAAVVFLHGFTGHARDTWGDFPWFLVAESRLNSWGVYGLGYPSSLRLDIPSWDVDPNLSVLSSSLRTALQLPPFAAYQSLALVVHSMGGLIAQHALLHDEIAARVGHLFILGCPSGGLRKASWGGFFKRQLRDMAADSPFIRALRLDWETKYGKGTPFHLRVIAGDRDDFVPPDSSLTPFTDSVRLVVPGNHLDIVKPSAPDSRSVQAVIEGLLGSSAARGAVDSALVAVELRHFNQAIKTLEPRADELDSAALVQLALALESVGRGGDALSLLQARLRGGTTSTDAMGVLAGRLKRRWLNDRVEGDWKAARALYAEALVLSERAADCAQAMYHAINIAFLDLMISPAPSPVPPAVRAMAERALEFCNKTEADRWVYATRGEAQLMLGNLAEATERYRDALTLRPGPREVDSMYSQAVRVAGRVFGDEGVRRVEAVFGMVT